MYPLWENLNALKACRWVELSHSMNNDSPYWAGIPDGSVEIGKVVYGASDPKRGFSLFSPSLMHPKTEVVSGVLAEECGNLVSDFYRQEKYQTCDEIERGGCQCSGSCVLFV